VYERGLLRSVEVCKVCKVWKVREELACVLRNGFGWSHRGKKEVEWWEWWRWTVCVCVIVCGILCDVIGLGRRGDRGERQGRDLLCDVTGMVVGGLEREGGWGARPV
jgi:hypothetical protein